MTKTFYLLENGQTANRPKDLPKKSKMLLMLVTVNAKYVQRFDAV